MGTSFNTFAVPGARGAEVVDRLSDWYERRGFPLVEEESLFDKPAEDERWVIVAADDRWTIVIDTDRDEHERVGWEIARLGVPLLELWVHDSDVWGYRLFDGRREVESFNSNPRYFGGDDPDDETVSTELCRAAGLTGREREIEALFRQKKLFAEGALSRFAEAIGAPGAAADYPCWYDTKETRTRGYTVARLRFERPSPAVVVDVHSDRYPRRAPPRDRGNPGTPPLPPETAATFAALKTLGVAMSAIFAVLGFLLAPLMLAVRVIVRFMARKDGAAVARMIPGVTVEGRTVTVAPHGMRFDLPQGAEIEPQMFVVGLFAFRMGDLHLWCTARRRAELADQLTVAHDAVVDDDTRYFADNRAVRSLFFHEAQTDGRGKVTTCHRLAEIVDGPQALYVFWARSSTPIDPVVRAALRQAIEGLRFDRDRATESAGGATD